MSVLGFEQRLMIAALAFGHRLQFLVHSRYRFIVPGFLPPVLLAAEEMGHSLQALGPAPARVTHFPESLKRLFTVARQLHPNLLKITQIVGSTERCVG